MAKRGWEAWHLFPCRVYATATDDHLFFIFETKKDKSSQRGRTITLVLNSQILKMFNTKLNMKIASFQRESSNP